MIETYYRRALIIVWFLLLGWIVASDVAGQNIFDGYASNHQLPQTRLDPPDSAMLVMRETADGPMPRAVQIAFTQAVIVRNPLNNWVTSKGSGAYLGDGLYASAWHVVEKNPQGQIIIEWKDGRKYQGKVVGQDTSFDITLIETKEKPQGGIPIANSNAEIGSKVFLGGYSQGPLLTWSGKTVSYASPTNTRNADWANASGIASAISGDSGGPVLDQTGCYVGPLWGSGGGTTIFSNTGRFQRFLFPWNARLAAWQNQGYGCYGGQCPPPQQYQPPPQQYGGGGDGRVPVEENPGTPVTPPPSDGGNLGWPSGPPPQQPPAQPCECDPDVIADKIKKSLGDLKGEQGPSGPAGPKGDAGPRGEQGPCGEVTDEMLATIAAAVYQRMRDDPAFRGPQGPAGKDGAGVSADELERIKSDVLASLPDLRVLLVDGSNGTVIDDETYKPGEPLVLDFQRVINAARQR